MKGISKSGGQLKAAADEPIAARALIQRRSRNWAKRKG